MDASTPADVMVFEKWRLDGRRHALFRQNTNGEWQSAAIGSRAIAVLDVRLKNQGALVSKDAIMDEVWPRTVEPNNLTVQITAVRRILDEGRTDGSCIQTVPGRGYRFVIAVTKLDPHDETSSPWQPRSSGNNQAPPAVMPDPGGASKAPRLSMVVLPFENPSLDPNQDCVAAAITEDLTTDLCRLDGARVIACHARAPWRDGSMDFKRTGEALGVRYVIEGSTRKLAGTLRVNVQLISTEENTYLWAGRFDIDLNDHDRGQETIVSRMKGDLVAQMLAIESKRSEQERPDNQDAFDLLLRARSLLLKDDQTESLRNASSLLEQALRLDPSLRPRDVRSGRSIDQPVR